MKKIILLCLMLFSVMAFSKNFWEKSNFTVNVTENAKINNTTKVKSYVMSYNVGTLKLVITEPKINKGEEYTFKGNSKTVYYPSLKQTVTQKIQNGETTILNIFNKLRTITVTNTQTKNGDVFTFQNNLLTEIKSNGYTAKFSEYQSAMGYNYPTKISIKAGSNTINYNLSNFR